MVVGVGSYGVVEAGEIGEQALFELLKGLEAAPVQLLFFQILEEALYDGIVIWVTLGGEGLDHPQFIDDPAEISGGELRATIRMEHDALGDAA